jgi:uncharacterized protein (TIGR02246 family)
MKSFAALCPALVLAFIMTACNQAPPDTHDADVKAISDLEAQWNKDYAAKDGDKIASYYADDAVLIVPGTAAIQGKEAIRDSMKGMLADPVFSLKFQPTKVDVAKSGDLGYTWGTYQLTVTDPATKKPVNDHGSYVTTYRKQSDGSWKAAADIATSAVPPATPAPEPKKKR